jgi:hypothetical protein
MNPLAFLGLPDFGDGLLKSVSPKALGLAGLQGLSSAGSIMAQMGQTERNGERTAFSDTLQASNDFANANMAHYAGYGQVAGLRQQLNQQLQARTALAAASGVDAGGQGVTQTANAQITQSNDAAAQSALLSADMQSKRYQMNAVADLVRGQLAKQDADRAASAQEGTGILSTMMNVGKLLLMPAAIPGV